MIQFDDVSKRYADGTVAVGNLTIEMPSGQITVLVGSSGCGKTTSLRMINRMIEPSSGTISIDGRPIRSVPAYELRRGIGYVIQQAGLFPHRTIADNISTVPRLLGWDKARARSRALELMELVGLDPDWAGRYPAQLSGGQQQRVGVARALAVDPPVLLMDEPFGAVDPLVRTQLQREFIRLQTELHKTIVFVTHDIDEAVLLGDRIVVLSTGGVLEQMASPAEVLARPATAFVADFIGGDRTLRRLSLVSADDVAMLPMPTDGWTVEVVDGRPVRWCSPDGQRADVATVGVDANARALVDAIVASPSALAVRVDQQGRALGVVGLAQVRDLR